MSQFSGHHDGRLADWSKVLASKALHQSWRAEQYHYARCCYHRWVWVYAYCRHVRRSGDKVVSEAVISLGIDCIIRLTNLMGVESQSSVLSMVIRT